MNFPTRDGNEHRRLGNYHHLQNNGFSRIKVSECSAERTDLVHHCYYGSSCIDASNEFGLLDRFCECSTADELTAGLMCQFQATTVCVEADDIKQVTDQFCVNGGKCLSLVGAEDSHPGCSCEGVWEGHHCEFPHGILLDDALDLFQQRKAEIANGKNMDDGELYEGETEGRFIFSVVGSFVTVLAAINLFIFSAWMSRTRKSRQQSNDNDYQSIDVGTIASKATKSTHESISLAPPADVFLASRKKEVVSDDARSFTTTPGHETEGCENDAGDVEMLDAETSRILEAQFKSCEAECDEEKHLIQPSDGEPGNELVFAPSYESDNENIDAHSGLHSGRITINSGKNPLSKLQNETFSDAGMSDLAGENDDLDQHEIHRHNGVTNMDGESDDESDDGHYYV
eukprot:CAMPEP_0172556892 /NCGR_PEP_ID=MMETSP1067-20121228/69883_1 /TAXON_ID=265564 ORGANISM="Thalassiosira punctigera, Strain Tpunct2005C2" /NCGR_SAMPLE_ID=MMETSP1067 /ASSEMBLY_ACC=CAM_ASM_000444 /LENGTH=399 /DNA_ID=CAMNT_0013345819 /DNA_START=24 /DNA_END=1223 /DNA_ORIENTATION=+